MLRQAVSNRLARQCLQLRPFHHIADPSSSSNVATGPKVPLYAPPPTENEPEFEYPKTLDELPTPEDIKRQLKTQLSIKAVEGLPDYKEDDLRDFYRNLVLSGVEEPPNQLPAIEAPNAMNPEERTKLIEEVAQRLRAPKESPNTAAIQPYDDNIPRHVAITADLISLAPERRRGPIAIGMGIITTSEWQALFETFVHEQDAAGAEVLLSTMERHGVLPRTAHIDQVMNLYSRKGQTGEVARLISDLESDGVTVTNNHRDAIIYSYTSSVDPDIDGVMSLLTSAEDMGRPFPQSSYNIVLKRLTRATPTYQPDSRSRALAWDLFAQMRFAAHPVPSRKVYTTMIEACSSSLDPQPERARDLWLEMTSAEGNEMTPMKKQYDALIRALGSTKSDYMEAFDLLRQMLAKHHEATMVPFEDDLTPRLSHWVPTLETFTALLEGTKRAGDLERARWVLGEAVDLARTAAFSGHRLEGPDAELLSAVFQTYASWKPKGRRRPIGLRNEESAQSAIDHEGEAATSVVEVTEANDSTARAPETRGEAVREADMLFDRVLHDVRAVAAGEGNIVDHPFAGVNLTTRLVNSYLSVHLAHEDLDNARVACNATWEKLNTKPSTSAPPPQPNGWTYLATLQRCIHIRGQSRQRKTAAEWGEEAWADYLRYQKAFAATMDTNSEVAERQRFGSGVGDRQVEKAWAAAISLAAKFDVELGLQRLRDFVELYPPQQILDNYAPHLNRLKVRMMEPSRVAEANVPPLLMFSDIETLHHQCKLAENWDGVNYIKKVATKYEYTLAQRRKWRLRGAGVYRETKKEQTMKEARRLAAAGEPPSLPKMKE